MFDFKINLFNNNYSILYILLFILLICLIIFYIYFYNNNFSILNMIKYKNKMKPVVIVFDLDETLGYFTQLGCFCDVIEKHNNKLLTPTEFFEILDLNQEFLRPKIIELMQFILDLKKKKKVDSIMIYTNNQGPKRWADGIASYFSHKLEQPIFDKIIYAFKVNGQIVEPNRTSHEKMYSDLLKCTKIPKDTMVYFIDDVEHPKMVNDNVFYVKVKPYKYSLPMNTLLSRYANYKKLSMEESQQIWNRMNQSIPKQYLMPLQKDEEEHNIDTLTGKLLITQMTEFFDNYFKSEKLLNTSLKKYSNKIKKNKTLKIKH